MDKKVHDAIARKVAAEPFARKFGLKLVELEKGYAKVEMKYGEDIQNIFGMAHGGALFSLIDEAFEMTVNSHGILAVALNVNIFFMKAPVLGDTLYAEGREMSRSRKVSSCEVEVRARGRDELIARAQCMAYIKGDPLPFL